MRAAGKHYIVYPNTTRVFKIWNLSDLHIMNTATAEDKIKQDIQVIRNDPNSFWLGGGDYLDFIGYRDKRFDPDSVADFIKVSNLGELHKVGTEKLIEIFKPIKHKCLGLLLGNHEKKYALQTDQSDRHAWMCEELGVKNLSYCALFDIMFRHSGKAKSPLLNPYGGELKEIKSHYGVGAGKVNDERGYRSWQIRVFCHHGAGFAQTPGGKLNKLIQFMQSFEADISFCGHVHDQLARREVYIGADKMCRNLIEKVKLGVISGSYLKTYAQDCTTYGEQRGYRPVPLGAAVIEVQPDKRLLRASV